MKTWMEAHILTPEGRVLVKRVKSHRAFAHRYGLYQVDYSATHRMFMWNGSSVKAGPVMGLYFLGHPVPYPLCEKEENEQQIVNAVVRGNFIEKVTRVPKRGWQLPAWLITVGLLLVVLAAVW